MRCDTSQERFEAYLDGELPPAEAGSLKRHLAECPACRQALAEREVLRGRVREELDLAAPADLRAAILRDAARSPAGRTFWRRWLAPRLGGAFRLRPLAPSLAGAMAVLVLAMGTWWFIDRQSGGEQRTTFARPGTVVVLRYGETPAANLTPEIGGLVLGDPL